MSRTWLAASTCVMAVAITAAGMAQGRHAETAKAVNGTSLAGWHA